MPEKAPGRLVGDVEVDPGEMFALDFCLASAVVCDRRIG